MFKRLVSSMSFIISLIALPGFSLTLAAPPKQTVSDGYFVMHTVTAMTSTTCTLDDNSVWLIEGANTSPFLQEGAQVWIVPVMQENLYAVFFSLFISPTSVMLQSGGNTLSITAYNSSSGAVTLSDNSQWVLDPYYKNYFSGWKVGDPITLAGRHNEYFLINGSGGQTSATYSLASHASTTTNKPPRKPKLPKPLPLPKS